MEHMENENFLIVPFTVSCKIYFHSNFFVTWIFNRSKVTKLTAFFTSGYFTVMLQSTYFNTLKYIKHFISVLSVSVFIASFISQSIYSTVYSSFVFTCRLLKVLLFLFSVFFIFFLFTVLLQNSSKHIYMLFCFILLFIHYTFFLEHHEIQNIYYIYIYTLCLN